MLMAVFELRTSGVGRDCYTKSHNHCPLNSNVFNQKSVFGAALVFKWSVLLPTTPTIPV